MKREEFEAAAQRDGYDLREVEIKPEEHRDAHAHGWDARLFILQGDITLVYEGGRHVTYRAGDTCELAAGTKHEEHTDASGVRFIAARRSPATRSAGPSAAA